MPSIDTKSVVIVAGVVVGVGAAVYFMTSRANKRTAAAISDLNNDAASSYASGSAAKDIEETVRRELFNPNGSQSVRSGSSGATGLYYGDASARAALAAERRRALGINVDPPSRAPLRGNAGLGVTPDGTPFPGS